jgi:oxygen-independent coproporphyrinogen-3 oxidase
VGGVRWWNVRHPSTYTDRLAELASPAQAREVLTRDDRRTEAVMLGLRLREGMALTRVADPDEPGAVERTCAEFAADGLLDAAAWSAGQVRLSLRGRLLADHVVRTILTA